MLLLFIRSLMVMKHVWTIPKLRLQASTSRHDTAALHIRGFARSARLSPLLNGMRLKVADGICKAD